MRAFSSSLPLSVALAAGALLLGCATARPAATPPSSLAPGPASDIVQVGAPVLRAKAAPVPADKLGTPELRELVQRMLRVMREAPGVGLAAPQLGISWRLFVLEDRDQLIGRLTPQEAAERERVVFPARVVVNPTVQPVGEEKVTFFEGCLSVAGFSALVSRYREVEVSGVDEEGKAVRWRVRGWPARILQHELDHLDGTLYLDRMHSRSFGTTPQLLQRFGGRPIQEALDAFDLTGSGGAR